MADVADSGDALSDVAGADAPMSHGEHLAAAHGHVLGAAAHLAAMADPDSDSDNDSGGGPDPDAAQDSPAGRAMMPMGSAQSRAFRFAAGSGAARSLRAATGRHG